MRKQTEKNDGLAFGAGSGVPNSGGLPVHQMPASRAAEAAVLGSVIIDPDCAGEVFEQLGEDCFYHSEHRVLFSALVYLYEKNKGVGLDAVLLRDELEKRKQLDRIGGVEYIGKIMDSVPSSANVMYYSGIIRDKWLLREIINAASGILQTAYEGDGDTNKKLDEAEQRIFSIADKRITGSAESLRDLIVQAYELIERRDGKHITGIATGFYELDEMLCGLQNGEMVIIAGRPSMGKTSFALNIAEHIGVVEKLPVAIFSLEMGRQQLAERFLCGISRVESQRVRKGMLDTEHHRKLVEGCSSLSEAPIYIDDTASLTPLELRAKARRLKSRHDIRCVIVDYLQLMSGGSNRIESRQQEITVISRYIKALARELNVPVVVLSQLNRAAEGREGHRPRMSDLRESGSIEQDADVVMLLHREDYYHRGESEYQDTNTAEAIIAKQRNGPTGSIKMMFIEKFTRFENAAVGMEADSSEAPF